MASLPPSRKHNISSALTPYAATLVMLLPNSHAIDVTAAGNDDRLRCAAGHINQPFEIEQGIRPRFSTRLTLLLVNVYFRQSH